MRTNFQPFDVREQFSVLNFVIFEWAHFDEEIYWMLVSMLKNMETNPKAVDNTQNSWFWWIHSKKFLSQNIFSSFLIGNNSINSIRAIFQPLTS